MKIDKEQRNVSLYALNAIENGDGMTTCGWPVLENKIGQHTSTTDTVQLECVLT